MCTGIRVKPIWEVCSRTENNLAKPREELTPPKDSTATKNSQSNMHFTSMINTNVVFASILALGAMTNDVTASPLFENFKINPFSRPVQTQLASRTNPIVKPIQPQPTPQSSNPNKVNSAFLNLFGIGLNQYPQGDNAPKTSKKPVNIVNNGGNIIEEIEVTPIYYNEEVSAMIMYNDFYRSLVQKRYMGWLKEYNTDTQEIKSGSFDHSIYTNMQDASNGINIDDKTDIQPIIRSFITNNLITPTTNTYVPIHFGPGYNITYGDQHSCQDFCAYHDSLDISDMNIDGVSYIRYAVIPYHGDPICEDVCRKQSHSAAINTMLTATNEFVGAITNPKDGGVNTWYDEKNKLEIGDVCAYEYATFKDVQNQDDVLQQAWSNKRKACYAPPM
ncbi:hypothetical protein HDU76_004910 [Blyttiomyces sp. JEL0837]|nr:hypothetical protein HDU76_004910 [Blyttiomyces sp. JEL0837]